MVLRLNHKLLMMLDSKHPCLGVYFQDFPSLVFTVSPRSNLPSAWPIFISPIQKEVTPFSGSSERNQWPKNVNGSCWRQTSTHSIEFTVSRLQLASSLLICKSQLNNCTKMFQSNVLICRLVFTFVTSMCTLYVVQLSYSIYCILYTVINILSYTCFVVSQNYVRCTLTMCGNTWIKVLVFLLPYSLPYQANKLDLAKFFFCRVIHTTYCHLRAHAFARSLPTSSSLYLHCQSRCAEGSVNARRATADQTLLVGIRLSITPF